MATPEGKIQLEIMRHLRKRGLLFWRFSPETYNVARGFHYKHEYIPSGLPDIMVLTKEGFIGLEVKTPKGRPSADQLLMQKRFRRLGAEYHVVKSVADVDIVIPTSRG